MDKYNKLIMDCEKQLDNESRFSLKGIKLTRSDVETIKIYAETYQIDAGHLLMPPVCEVKQVLEAYDII
jgi:hypothetical protein